MPRQTDPGVIDGLIKDGAIAAESNTRIMLSRGRTAKLADLGTVEVGKLADLIAVDGNPLQDIRAARKTRITIRNGEVFRVSDLVRK